MQELFNFLVEAKRNTYASGKDDFKVESTRKESTDYEFSQNGLTYHDTFFGKDKFAGQEIVYKNNKPLWTMTYYGMLLDEKLEKEVFEDVLKPALMLVADQLYIPVRGPREWDFGEYKYTCDIVGSLEFFSGTESIFKNGKRVYVLRCSGGRITN